MNYRECIFLHDDWRSWSAFDEHSTFPLIIGAGAVVSHDLPLVPPACMELWRREGVWPETTFSPRENGECSSIANLLEDQDCLDEVAEFLRNHDSEVSLFYPNHPRQEDLMNALAHPELLGPPEDDTNPKHRAEVLDKLRVCGLPVLRGELVDAGGYIPKWAETISTVIKAGRRAPVVAAPSTIELLDVGSPFYLEEFVRVRDAYCVHVLNVDGIRKLIGVNRQIIHNLCHIGNQITENIPSLVSEIGLSAASGVGSSSNIVGVDVVTTHEGETYVVDVNERFNTSTYVHIYLNSVYRGEKYKFSFIRKSKILSDYIENVRDKISLGAILTGQSLVLGISSVGDGLVQYYELRHQADSSGI